MTVKTNSDPAFVADMRRRLKETGGYCPCSVVRNEDTKCICKEFWEMEEGPCHCGLYIKIKSEE